MGREPKPRETIETPEQAQRYAMQYAESESRKVRKRPDSQVKADSAEVNGDFLRHNLRLMQYPALSIHSSAAEIRERVNKYFDICAEDGMRATVAGLALALGIDRRRLWEISSGKGYANGVGAETQEIIKRAYQLVNAQIETMMIAGQSAPIPSIFLLKAQFCYEDTHRLEVVTGSAAEETATAEELEKKYQDAIPVDYDDLPGIADS